MKRNKSLIYMILVLTCMPACDDAFLERNNPASITSEELWSDASLIGLYVNDLYNDRPGWDYNTYDNVADEARSNYAGGPNQLILGEWNEVKNPLGDWAYEKVRKTNDFLDQIGDATIDEEEKAVFTGEARFLRAFLYFDMVKRYGGIPIIESGQRLNDDLEVPRNSTDECFNFIVRELDQAITELPRTAHRGKATIGSAIALKGRVSLYHASALFNPDNDHERWGISARVNKALIETGQYGLYPDHDKLWLETGAHKESIFEVQYKLPFKSHGWDAFVKPLVIANGDAGQRSPLQELVNAFPMKNGKRINESGSGYNPDFPYEGRDDRFYSFIAYNGSKMKGTAGGPLSEITLEIYDGGRDFNTEQQMYNTITGYYTVKAVNPENTIYQYGYGSEQPWIELRYTEVLLNYAEAQNEYLSSPEQSVYDAVNSIRNRAGITDEIPMGSLNKAEMRDLIRNERYVELCFEGKRYWDLRRWKVAATVLNGKQYTGVFIVKNDDGSLSYSYVTVDPQPMVFEEKMYFMPIPKSEMSKNRRLVQNEGWPK